MAPEVPDIVEAVDGLVFKEDEVAGDNELVVALLVELDVVVTVPIPCGERSKTPPATTTIITIIATIAIVVETAFRDPLAAIFFIFRSLIETSAIL